MEALVDLLNATGGKSWNWSVVLLPRSGPTRVLFLWDGEIISEKDDFMKRPRHTPKGVPQQTYYRGQLTARVFVANSPDGCEPPRRSLYLVLVNCRKGIACSQISE